MMWDWYIFLWGCIGALAPEVARIYKRRQKKILVKNLWLYIIASILFIGLGGILANLLNAQSWLSSFYIGICWPSIVTVAGQKKPEDLRSLSPGQITQPNVISSFREYLWILIS